MLLLILGCGDPGSGGPQDAGNSGAEPALPAETVRLLSSADCASDVPGHSSDCYHIGVTCQDMPEREIQVRRYTVGTPTGGVIFIGPSEGKKPYSSPNHDEAVETVSVLLDAGYEVFEFRWWDENGWLTGVDAVAGGYRGAMCGYAAAVRWVHGELMERPDVLCALGNSGGALQNAYGLVRYGLDDFFDMVIFTGGPPVPRIDDMCAGIQTRAAGAAVAVADKLHGWEGAGDYCKNHDVSEEQLLLLDQDALISDSMQGDVAYPTKLNFVGAEGDGAFQNGREFYEFVDSPKGWFEYPGRDHWFDMTPEGAQKVRELFVAECSAR